MKDYKQLSKELRREVLVMTHRAQSSHIGSNFSSADIMTVLYDLADFSKDIVLFKSWNVANAYALLVRKGLLPQEAIDDYGKEGTPWTTIAEAIPPYIPFGIGSMGMNLPAAVGFALAKKLKGEEGRVYCIISDGELNIGSTWEAALIATQHRLDNLVVIVDKNGLQAMGKTVDILNVNQLMNKWESFGWGYYQFDGHDWQDIFLHLRYPHKENQPVVLVANTTKGKGVSFFENNNLWHYSHVNEETLNKALEELK